ncbi:helix-turn-helix transcriptional regulator [Cohnella algarum]|uniref:helix-turn-helix transcriptional regulator n=1 Tax=Cohnella algarum TaxID=2044859 RepID=UPI0019675A35|nr:AraC family transcriptional regulator [Cohnella algarum]MBN2982051.1 helix-turn-helix transcriptional regulator [Cohnella algarum]
MTRPYFSILMKHLEQMNVDVTAASETTLAAADTRGDGLDAYDCNRFIYVVRGVGRLLLENEEIALKPGCSSIVFAGTRHDIRAGGEADFAFKWCHFRDGYGDWNMYRLLRLPYAVKIETEEAERLLDKMKRLSLESGPTSKLRIKAAILELISSYLEHLPENAGKETEAPNQEMEKIGIVLRYIDEHIGENLTVEELARQVFLHPNYFIVFFKSMMGCSPIQYVNQRRMEIARSLLLKPECNVSDVANRIGMKIYYFSRMFKSHTGLAPSRYRKLAGIFPGMEERERPEKEDGF